MKYAMFFDTSSSRQLIIFLFVFIFLKENYFSLEDLYWQKCLSFPYI